MCHNIKSCYSRSNIIKSNGKCIEVVNNIVCRYYLEMNEHKGKCLFLDEDIWLNTSICNFKDIKLSQLDWIQEGSYNNPLD